MGEINCKDCAKQDQKFINELCFGSNSQTLDYETKIYIDKAGNKSKTMPKDNSKNEDKDSEFGDEKNPLPKEDKELLSKINYNFEKINDESIEDVGSQKVFSNTDVILNSTSEKNSVEEFPSQEKRYIEPYEQSYQDYDLNNLEHPQNISQEEPKYDDYISYKDCQNSAKGD